MSFPAGLDRALSEDTLREVMLWLAYEPCTALRACSRALRAATRDDAFRAVWRQLHADSVREGQEMRRLSSHFSQLDEGDLDVEPPSPPRVAPPPLLRKASPGHVPRRAAATPSLRPLKRLTPAPPSAEPSPAASDSGASAGGSGSAQCVAALQDELPAAKRFYDELDVFELSEEEEEDVPRGPRRGPAPRLARPPAAARRRFYVGAAAALRCWRAAGQSADGELMVHDAASAAPGPRRRRDDARWPPRPTRTTTP